MEEFLSFDLPILIVVLLFMYFCSGSHFLTKLKWLLLFGGSILFIGVALLQGQQVVTDKPFFKGYAVPNWGGLILVPCGLYICFLIIRSMIRKDKWDNPTYTDKDIEESKRRLAAQYTREYGEAPPPLPEPAEPKQSLKPKKVGFCDRLWGKLWSNRKFRIGVWCAGGCFLVFISMRPILMYRFFKYMYFLTLAFGIYMLFTGIRELLRQRSRPEGE